MRRMMVLFAVLFAVQGVLAGDGVDALAFYYPHWHVYPRGEQWFGKGWTEWEFVKTQVPRYPGHPVPIKPLMGYYDESKPENVEKEIDLAADAGIGAFLFDWYCYDGEVIMEEALEKGFLKAKNLSRMKFALMWCYHDRYNRFRAAIDDVPGKLLIRRAGTPDEFRKCMDIVIDRFLGHPQYYRKDGRPFYSIFNAPDFVKKMGGPAAARRLLEEVDAKVAAKGLPSIHWNGIQVKPEQVAEMKAAGFHSCAVYNVTCNHLPDYSKRYLSGEQVFEYKDVADAHRRRWAEYDATDLPYLPTVTRGWDCSGRCRNDEPMPWKSGAYPYGGIVRNNDVETFRRLLADAKARVEADPKKPGIILLNAWNEYTEGCWLVPDENIGDASLRAVRSVMRPAVPAKEDRRPMALMVFFDGARADLAFTERCPNLRSLVAGTWAEGYRCAWSDAGQNIFDARTLSYPNHSSILCGVTAAKHHVMNNDQVRTKGDRHGWPTWCKRLVTARPELKARAFFADSNDARIMPDAAVPMTVAQNKDWRLRDEETTRAAEEAYRRADAPNAGLFFLEGLDSTGHYCGYYPTSDDYQASYAASDARLGRVLAAIRSRPTFDREDWMIAFTSDHGGKLLGHGWDDGHCHTVPLLVVGRRVAHGVLPGCPRTYDLAPTLLAHFGVGAEGMDGQVIGSVAQWLEERPFDSALFCYEPFETPGPRTVDVKPGARVTSRWGYADRLFTGLTAASSAGAPPVSPSYGRVAGRDVSAAFRLEGSAAAFAGENPAFTLAFWMLDEGKAYGEDPIVLGNKNIFSFLNHGFQEKDTFPGFAIFLRTRGDDGSRGVTLKYTAGDGRTMRSLGSFIPERGQWDFYALSVHPDGKAMLYQGRRDGRLHWIAADCRGAKWASGGPLMVGQDLTGQYVDACDLCFDELRLWKRALTSAEIEKVFKGSGK